MENLDVLMDSLVDDIKKIAPEMGEFEAAFSAVRVNLTIMTKILAEYGANNQGLNTESLYGMCSGLVDMVQWMAAKELTSLALRELNNEEL